MNRRLAALMLVVLAAAWADLLACGDKFLVTGRGTRFDRPGAIRPPATVLFYATPQSKLSATLVSLSVESSLRKVGYLPTAVSDPDSLDRAIRAAKWDLVVVDLSDREAVRSRLHGEIAPAVIAVTYDISGDALKEARRDHQEVVKSPTRCATILSAIDEVLFARAEQGKTAAKKPAK